MGKECEKQVVERLGVSHRIFASKGRPGTESKADLEDTSVCAPRKARSEKTYDRRNVRDGSLCDFVHAMNRGIARLSRPARVIDGAGRRENMLERLDG